MKISKKILSIVLVLLLIVGIVPISATAEDTNETYTLTLVYAHEGYKDVIADIGIDDVVIENISHGTVVDFSKYWPDELTVTGSNGEIYYLGGFKKSSTGGGGVYSCIELTEDTTLYAVWSTEPCYVVEFEPNGGEMNFEKILTVKTSLGTLQHYYYPTRNGYTFLGWSLENDGTADDPDITKISENCTLYAIWEEKHSHCVCGGNTNIGDHTTHSDIEFTPWTSTNSMPTDAGNYVLMNDVTIADTWKPKDGTILCLNGHTLSAPVVDVVQNYKFTLCDCGDGKITTGESTSAEVIFLYADSTFNMYGGKISSGNDRRGVYVANAWFNMYGGCITDNATEETGAGVYLYGVAKMTMYGGSITNNTSKETGGGVHNEGIFIMTGGEISGNSSINSTGGGVWSATEAPISISGNAVITENTGKEGTNNLHLASNGTIDAKITVGELGINASVGVSVDDNHGMVISEGGKDYKNKFFSDDGAYAIAVDGENLKLVEKTVQVGMVTLGNGEYTVNGGDKTEGKPTGTGYAYFENGVLTLNNFTYSGGSVHSNLAIGSDLAAIFSEHDLTIKVEGENSIERVVTDADTDKEKTLRGIWNNGDLEIVGDSRDDILKVTVSGHDGALANAVESIYESVIIENCTLEAKSVTGGYALLGNKAITITRAKVVGSSGIANDSRSTFGIYTGTLTVTDSDVIGIAENNAVGKADGIHMGGKDAKLIFESGSIIAKTSDVSDDSYAIYVNTGNVTLPAKYWMRTSASGEYVNGT